VREIHNLLLGERAPEGEVLDDPIAWLAERLRDFPRPHWQLRPEEPGSNGVLRFLLQNTSTTRSVSLVLHQGGISEALDLGDREPLRQLADFTTVDFAPVSILVPPGESRPVPVRIRGKVGDRRALRLRARLVTFGPDGPPLFFNAVTSPMVAVR
jgi:hypothetical protein